MGCFEVLLYPLYCSCSSSFVDISLRFFPCPFHSQRRSFRRGSTRRSPVLPCRPIYSASSRYCRRTTDDVGEGGAAHKCVYPEWLGRLDGFEQRYSKYAVGESPLIMPFPLRHSFPVSSLLPSFAQSPDGSMFWLSGQEGEIISVWCVLCGIGFVFGALACCFFGAVESVICESERLFHGNRWAEHQVGAPSHARCVHAAVL